MHLGELPAGFVGGLLNTAPEFASYPVAQAPVYSRWVASGVALLVLLSGGNVAMRSHIAPGPAIAVAVGAMLVWLVALLLRVLYVRLSRHNAQCYAQTSAQVSQAWWARHRESAALVEAVLVGAPCTCAQQGQLLFGSNHRPPAPQETPEGSEIRLCQVFGSDVSERERNLAILLALQWYEQHSELPLVQPLRCFWQGSLQAWQAFVEQATLCFPRLRLPERPEPWQGIRSLGSVIDQLKGAPADVRILCAGCQSSSVEKDNGLAAGEAALLWLVGSEGSVRLSRGEWFDAGREELATVARRALLQSKLTEPSRICVSFSQPDMADLSASGWNTQHNIQDANFGALGNLQPMVAQTLAAWYVEQNREPCAWIANDPHHTLALGIVKPDDSNS